MAKTQGQKSRLQPEGTEKGKDFRNTKKKRTLLVVQWLRFCTPKARGMGLGN